MTGPPWFPIFFFFNDTATTEIYTLSLHDALPISRMIAQRYRLNHHEINVEPRVTDIIQDIVAAFDEPFADDSVIPSYYVSQAAARFVKVALDRKSTRLNSSHSQISYAVFCLKKKNRAISCTPFPNHPGQPTTISFTRRRI